MVDFASLLLLLAMAALVWCWLHSIRILELAREAGRQACSRADVQFLDDTVASTPGAGADPFGFGLTKYNMPVMNLRAPQEHMFQIFERHLCTSFE
jgi:hypothetical protein